MSDERIKGFIGVVHLAAMPGDPLHSGGGFEAVEKAALQDAGALVRGGIDGLILENFGSAPFPRGTADQPTAPHQVAAMAMLARKLVDEYGQEVAVGVNCLRNDVRAALGIAAAVGARFVRVNVHTGAMVTDQGLIQGEAYETLRYRMSLGAEVAIMADVLVKHAAPLAPLAVDEAVRECTGRGLADGVIITGRATGGPIDLPTLEQARGACGEHPLLLGSGVSPENAAALCPLADGAIVGTWLKRGGDVGAPVDEERVRRLAGVLGEFWNQEPGTRNRKAGSRKQEEGGRN